MWYNRTARPERQDGLPRRLSLLRFSDPNLESWSKSWRNPFSEPCRIVVVLIGAERVE
jgi:hypothetical protein